MKENIFSKLFDFQDNSQVLVQITRTPFPAVKVSTIYKQKNHIMEIDCDDLKEAQKFIASYSIKNAVVFRSKQRKNHEQLEAAKKASS